jgi:hypothetical protein
LENLELKLLEERENLECEAGSDTIKVWAMAKQVCRGYYVLEMTCRRDEEEEEEGGGGADGEYEELERGRRRKGYMNC